jgi:CheY-like chemotaxis protein
VILREVSAGIEGILEARKERPDAIILDLTMPAMNGFEVLDALKSDVATRDIPVIICTSRVLNDSERLRLEGKTAAVLSKEESGLQEIAEVIRRTVMPARIDAVVS